WEAVAIKNRDIVIVFDSDVVEKPSVEMAMKRLRRMLLSRGARRVRVAYLPSEDGSKVGIDDWLAAGHELAEFEQYLQERVRESGRKPVVVVGPGRSVELVSREIWQHVEQH